MDSTALITVLVLAAFTGYEVISKVSVTLHTPLMSGSNAISGIILVGTVIVAARADTPAGLALALFAVGLAAVNLMGGFVVTDRMLRMFRGRGRRPDAGDRKAETAGSRDAAGGSWDAAGNRDARVKSRKAE